MSKFNLLLAAVCAAVLSVSAQAEQQPPLKVLVSTRVTEGLARQLLQSTNAEVERAVPANLPASRHSAYFGGRGAQALHKIADKADVVISLRSIWPNDPLYPQARRSNIRIIEVDAARPVDGALPGIAIDPDDREAVQVTQPWLTNSNMGRMADVIAADLVRIAPADKDQIEANLASIKHRLLELSAKTDRRLAHIDNLTAVALSAQLRYLLEGMGLDTVNVADITPPGKWTPEALQQLSALLEDEGVAAVVTDQKVSPEVRAAIEQAGSTLVVIPDAQDDPLTQLEQAQELILKVLETSS